ncbi:hypothetical protein [Nocardia testacea]|uniref:hypothetical protein n=1 Tax=Nocardia testacea TaxID=248551 RepID=UPI0012F6CF4E|nr:hypothetical protein [Nocardia testacea]
MSFDVGSVAAAGGWTVFWLQLPATVLVIAVIVVGLAAILRARPEDVPAVFRAFTAAFGNQPAQPKVRRLLPRRRRPSTTQTRLSDTTGEHV